MATRLLSALRLLGCLLATAGACILGTGWLAHSTHPADIASRMIAVGSLALPAGIILLAVARPRASDARRLLAVTVGLWPFAAFGAFLWWQIGLSTEQRHACITEANAEACERLAHRRHRRGHHADAAELHERACSLDRGRSCFSLAGLALHGHLGDRDPGTARRWLSAGCALEHPESCARLGALKRLGQGGPADPEGAQQALDIACQAGIANACAERDLIQSGTPLP